ncbi:MAG: hypothetical protein HC909_01915 [Blastochloris sp.]|nr:hypothetical protein [Blastochloris sp.]
MSGRFDFAADLYRDADTPEKRRLAARMWLTDAIQQAVGQGENVAPAIALLAALEGLDFGHVDPMLKLPAGRERGGKEGPPGETGLFAMALASIDRLIELDLNLGEATALVAGELGLEKGALTSKRKHVLAERGKPASARSRYRELISEYERERLVLADLPKEAVLGGLRSVGRLIGAKGSPTPIP